MLQRYFKPSNPQTIATSWSRSFGCGAIPWYGFAALAAGCRSRLGMLDVNIWCCQLTMNSYEIITRYRFYIILSMLLWDASRYFIIFHEYQKVSIFQRSFIRSILLTIRTSECKAVWPYRIHEPKPNHAKHTARFTSFAPRGWGSGGLLH